MKKLYSEKLIAFSFLVSLFFISNRLTAQCVIGSTLTGVAYDTTIITQSGFNTIQIKFPQFDPELGMLNCLRLCISITGVVDSVSVENNSMSSQTADIYYTRFDQLTGPGLASPLFNNVNKHYGPYPLSAADFATGSGPDFFAISKDTVLKAETLCTTLNDPSELAIFYGHDSVTYTYTINALTSAVCTGGNYNSSISTSAFVNFRFEYCVCSIVTLPLNVRDFFAKKIATDKAELTWSGFDETGKIYTYEVEMSLDGHQFTTIASVPKNASDEHIYKYVYSAWDASAGMRYFRIKQVYSNGYTRFSDIRSVQLESTKIPKFLVYPNPSNGIVGIKFDNNWSAQMMAQIYNSSGQCVLRKDFTINSSSYMQLGNLQSGMYWIKLTDKKTQATCVDQLIIK